MDNSEIPELNECIVFKEMMDDETVEKLREAVTNISAENVPTHFGTMERLDIEEPEFEWNTFNEWLLFRTMLEHRPIGRNKHIEMACIVERFQQVNINISAETIWAHLHTMYNLELLDELADKQLLDEADLEYDERETRKEEPEKKNGKYIKRIENTDTTKITYTKDPKKEKRTTRKKNTPRRRNKDGKGVKHTVTQKKHIKKEVPEKNKPMKTRRSVAKKEEKKNRVEEALKRGNKRPARLEYGARKAKNVKNGKSIKIIENKDTTKITNTKDPKEGKKATGKKDTPQRDRKGGKAAKINKEVLEKPKPMKTRSSVAKKEERKKRTPNKPKEALKGAAKQPARLEYGARKVRNIKKVEEKDGKSIKIIENKDTTKITYPKDPKEETKATGKKDNLQRDRKEGKSAKRTVTVKNGSKKKS